MDNRKWSLALLPVVIGYAVIMVLQILVWNPMSAAPGQPYPQVVDHLRVAGVHYLGAVVVVTGIGSVGVVIAVRLALAGIRRRLAPISVVARQLAVIGAGAPVYMAASFPLGIGVADTFGVDGAAWGAVLMCTSGLALAVLGVGAIIRAGRRGPAPRPSGQPTAG